MVGLPPATTPRPKSILILEDDVNLSELFVATLEAAGYSVDAVTNGVEGMAYLENAIPDLIISDIMMPEMTGLDFLAWLRSHNSLRFIPLILLTTKAAITDVVKGFELGADDYLTKPIDLQELVVRVQSKILRPPIPLDSLRQDRQTGLLSEAVFFREVEDELHRANRVGYPCTLVQFSIYEIVRVRELFGSRMDSVLALSIGKILQNWALPLEHLGRTADGSFLIFSPETTADAMAGRLDILTRWIVRTNFTAATEGVRVTPIFGYAEASPGETTQGLRDKARIAMSHAGAHLDLRPMRFDPSMEDVLTPKKGATAWLRAILEPLRLPLQILVTFLIGWGVPFAIFAVCDRLGYDISEIAYILAVISMLNTAILIWIEGWLSLKRADPPELKEEEFGPVSAIIAAYLPNEAPTLETTLETFLKMDYPGKMQIILAYNTPVEMPIEERFREIARMDPRFVPMRVDGSTSKAQNVNAAISIVTSPIVGIYDADHHPDPDSFRRAASWIASGVDVVQGHCFIRNHDASWLSRIVAIEFEQIYTVSHPGRARLHGFGLFGGSNGFWRTDVLREVRMRGSMLTEDIDSSLRALENGYKIISDPYLVSRELSPITLTGLTNQRLRWAQGWYQVAKTRFIPAMVTRKLSLRQKMGLYHLLAWREIFPWLSMLMFPLVGFWMWRAGSIYSVDWFVPIFVWISLFILLTGPGQLIFTYLNSDPQAKKRKSCYWNYLIMSVVFYAGYKNILARVANLKEILGEREWRVTPRS